MRKILLLLSMGLFIGYLQAQTSLIIEDDTTICQGDTILLHYSGGSSQSCVDITVNMLVVPTEYGTIQAAIDAAVTGDTVIVLPGTYSGTGNRNLSILNKNIVLMSSCGPDSTIIDCGNATRALTTTASVVVLDGFTIMNSLDHAPTDWSLAMTIYFDGDSDNSVMRNMILKNNNVTSGYISTRGYLVRGEYLTIDNCLMYNNNITGGSGTSGGGHFGAAGTAVVLGVYGLEISNSVMYNNTVTAYNKALCWYGETYAPVNIINSIIWGNSVNLSYQPSTSVWSINATYSCIEGGYTGTGNISTNPLFVNPTSGDFSLQPSSPSIGAGSTGNDMGVMFVPILSWSTGETTSEIMVSPSTTTTYTLTTTLGSTVSSDNITVTVLGYPTITFDIPDYISYDSSPLVLNGTPTGGVYSGNGITGNQFHPDVAGLGTSNITYFYSDSTVCPSEVTVPVIVYDTLGVVCTSYDTVLISVTDTLIIDVTLTGIPAPNNVNTVKVYPNPTSDYVVINTGDYNSMNNYAIKIMNSLSQIVWESFVTQQEYQIDVNSFGGYGTYFINIYDDSGTLLEVKKLILQ